MNNIIEIENQHAFDVYPKREIVIVRGKGVLVWDSDGNQYVDCVGGHGVAGIGHGNKEVAKALASQAVKIISCPGIFYNDTRAVFLERLMSIVPENLTSAFLCNSGAESIEGALKFARFATGNKEFICAVRGFHGRTMGALSATHNPKYRDVFLPLVPGFHFVPFNNIEKLKAKLNNNIAAILLEVVQGEGGVIVGDLEYFKKVQELCNQRDIVLIIDEVQTGFCRTGRMFGVEHFDIKPDIMCVAKAMAGGVPMGAVLCSSRIKVPKGKHGSTFGGNPLSCAAGIAAINYMMDNNLALQAEKKGNYILERLKKIQSERVRYVRGLGLIIGIELREKVKPYIQELMKEGVLVLPAGQTVLRLLPPLIIDYEEITFVIEKIEKVLSNK
jgi:acetylornithine/LysW-gamma-L-lysine aminotransferase